MPRHLPPGRARPWLACATALALLASACASPRVPAQRYVIDAYVEDAALEDFDVVAFVDVDLHTAQQTRDAVEAELRARGHRAGHLRWFFHAFDEAHLDFVVARFDPDAASGAQYVAVRRLRVKRTPEAERGLGVAEVVCDYELGVGRRGDERRVITARPEPSARGPR